MRFVSSRRTSSDSDERIGAVEDSHVVEAPAGCIWTVGVVLVALVILVIVLLLRRPAPAGPYVGSPWTSVPSSVVAPASAPVTSPTGPSPAPPSAPSPTDPWCPDGTVAGQPNFTLCGEPT